MFNDIKNFLILFLIVMCIILGTSAYIFKLKSDNYKSKFNNASNSLSTCEASIDTYKIAANNEKIIQTKKDQDREKVLRKAELEGKKQMQVEIPKGCENALDYLLQNALKNRKNQ